MKAVLLVGDRAEVVNRLKRYLSPKHPLLTATSEEVQELLTVVPVDVALVDSSIKQSLSLLRKVKSLQPACITACLIPSTEEVREQIEGLMKLCDFVIKEPFSRVEVEEVMDRALEKRRMFQELASLRSKASPTSVRSTSPPATSPRLGEVLKGLAKSLSTGFDLDRLLSLFLETVTEMVHPSKVCLLVLDSQSNEYRVGAYRGLSPKLVTGLRLKPEQGLPLWLAKEGRIIRGLETEEKTPDPFLLEVDAGLQAIQAVAGVPLIARGNLVGILGLGYRVTGLPYTDEELETIFTLASHMGVAIQDIQLYHQTQYQKAYIEDILVHMSSGVINIDSNERVVIFNHRAEEIVNMKAKEVLNKDLRCLPSPLGDLLFETLRTGKAYRKLEVELLPHRLPLEVNTYRLYGSRDEPLGSVMVFDDLSFRRELDEEKVRSERLDVLNRVVGWIAHEIKNPLVSIRTLVELLPERYNDQEFRERFGSVAGQEVKSLDEMVEKLVTLTERVEYHYQEGEINPLLDGCISSLQERGLHGDRVISTDYQDGLPKIKCDPEQLKKAFIYMLGYLMKSTPSRSKVSVSTSLQGDQDGSQWLEVRISCSALDLPPERLDLLFDPFDKDSAFDLGLCVSRRIVEEHGGMISVETDKRGKGVSFSIRLPSRE